MEQDAIPPAGVPNPPLVASAVSADALPVTPTASDLSAAATAAASSEPPRLAPAAEVHSFQFHGEAAEYFRIWIVNTLLTLLTAGLFFAWAKVRKRRYLRGCTELNGHRFDYTANPVRLLIGHLLMVTLFLGYSLFGAVYPVVRFGVLGVGVLLLPWIVVRSLSFNAHQTVYRGIRFRFHPSLSSATMVYLLKPVLVIASLGFYYPAWARAKRHYLVNNHRYGDAYFRFEAGLGPFYAAYLIGAGIFMGAIFIGLIIIGIMTVMHKGEQPSFGVMAVFFALYGAGLFVSRHFIHARLFNHIWNHTRLDEHRFVARMEIDGWLGLQLKNLGAILISGGLLYPWAVVRAHRYTASCLSLEPAGPIDSVQRIGSAHGSATGDSAAEFIGLDFGL
jgi:uncharacterized membrane protein YjgN (DUF898 family)